MNGFFDPELYEEANWTEAYGEWVTDLINHIPNMTWKVDEAILDIGCGDGNITVTQLIPSLPAQTSDGSIIDYDVTGVDNSDAMIQHANQLHSTKSLHFFAMDIEQVNKGFVINGKTAI